MTECPVIVQDTDTHLVLSSYNRTVGTYVQIGCRQFGYRFQGPSNVTCLATGKWSATLQYQCEWTGELNTYEKLIIGTAAGAGGLLLICLVAICCFGWLARKRKRDQKLYNGDGFEIPLRDQQIQHTSGSVRKSGPYADHIRPTTDHGRESGFYASRIVPHSPKSMNSRTTTDVELRNDSKTYEDSGYTYYTGKKGTQLYDNRAFDHMNPDKQYLNPQSGGNREEYSWSGQIPRPQVGGASRQENRHVI